MQLLIAASKMLCKTKLHSDRIGTTTTTKDLLVIISDDHHPAHAATHDIGQPLSPRPACSH